MVIIKSSNVPAPVTDPLCVGPSSYIYSFILLLLLNPLQGPGGLGGWGGGEGGGHWGRKVEFLGKNQEHGRNI